MAEAGLEFRDNGCALRAVDTVDKLRGTLNNREHGALPEIHDDLLRLHQLAMTVINTGMRSQASELFALAGELDFQVSVMMESLQRIQETLSGLMALYPESLS